MDTSRRSLCSEAILLLGHVSLYSRGMTPSYGVPVIPSSHPFHLNRLSSLTGERSLIAGFGSFDSLVNSLTNRAAVERLIKSFDLVMLYCLRVEVIDVTAIRERSADTEATNRGTQN